MKRSYPLLLILLVSPSAGAQIRIGGGYTASFDRFRVDGDLTSTPLRGLYIDAGYEKPLLDRLSLVPGMQLSYVERSHTQSFSTVQGDFSVKESYFTLSVDLEYQIDVTKRTAVFFYGGPRVAAGLYSVSTGTGISLSGHERPIRYRNYDVTDYSHFDGLAGGGAGLQFVGGYRVKAGMDFGLLNRYNGGVREYSHHRNVCYVGVDFLF